MSVEERIGPCEKERLFSIVTVTYNASKVIYPTLESVRRQLSDDYEYVVVDGASTDDTLDCVRASGIKPLRIVSEPDKGLYYAMNKGIKLARGKYLIFLNAGDSFAGDDVLSRLADKARSGEYDILYGQTQLVDDDRHVIGLRHLTAPDRLTADSFKHGMVVCHQAFVVRRSIAPQFDLRYRFSADYEWCIRCLLLSKGNGYVGQVPIIDFLTTAEGTTERNHRASLKERFKIMCHYYGTMPTVFRHLSFIPRYMKEKRRKERALKNEK